MAKHGKTERSHPAFKYGTDKQFLEWVSYQPSAIDGGFNQYNPNRNIPCHVRRISNGAGTGKKPPFSAIPMTDKQHKIQTFNGEDALLAHYNINDKIWSVYQAKEWFENMATTYLKRWIMSRT